MAAFGLANTASTLFGGVLLEARAVPVELSGAVPDRFCRLHDQLVAHPPDPRPRPRPDRSPRQPLTREVGRTLRYPRFGRFLLAVVRCNWRSA